MQSIRAGVIKPPFYTMQVPAGFKEKPIPNILTGNFCMVSWANSGLKASASCAWAALMTRQAELAYRSTPPEHPTSVHPTPAPATLMPSLTPILAAARVWRNLG